MAQRYDDSFEYSRGQSRSRSRGQSRSRSQGASSRENGRNGQYSTGRRSGYEENYTRNSRSRSGRNSNHHNDQTNWILPLGGVLAICLIAAIGLAVSGKFKKPTETEMTEKATEVATEAFDPDTIKGNVYVDVSSFSPDSGLVNLNGMNREQAKQALEATYQWKLVVNNTNPSLDSFKMPELTEAETTMADASDSVDNEGTEQVQKVASKYADISIRPDKASFLIPDLIAKNLDSFIEQIFLDYAEKGTIEAVTDVASSNVSNADTSGTESRSSIPEGTQAHADYALTLPDFTDIINDYMNQLATVWAMAPKNGDINAYDAQTGEFTFGGSVNGYSVNAEATAEKVLSAIKAGKFTESIDCEGSSVEASSQKENYTTIGSYQTKTTNNAIRNGNVKLAAAAINGTILQPGEEFSFNGTVGQRTEAKGYGAAPAYNAGEVVQEVGGGVCQVSTTLFNAVFRSGLTTTYRRSHTFAPNYVTPGQDATVSWPGPDYKFVNDSSHAIGIRAYYKDNICSVSIYGVRVLPEGVTWELTSEKVKDLPVPDPVIITPEEGTESNGSAGSEWQAYKVITTNGVVTKEKDHYTKYKGHTPKKYAESMTESASTEETSESGESGSETESSTAEGKPEEPGLVETTVETKGAEKSTEAADSTKAETKEETKTTIEGPAGGETKALETSNANEPGAQLSPEPGI